MEGQNGVAGDAEEAMDTGETERQEKTATAKLALRMSFAEYRRISNLLVLHMQKMEQCESLRTFTTEIAVPFIIESELELTFCISVDEESSLKKSELVNWYLKEIESEIESEADLIARKNLIERVLHRLVHYVSVDRCEIS